MMHNNDIHACVYIIVLLCLEVCNYSCLPGTTQNGSISNSDFWRFRISHFHFWKVKTQKSLRDFRVSGHIPDFVFLAVLGNDAHIE